MISFALKNAAIIAILLSAPIQTSALRGSRLSSQSNENDAMAKPQDLAKQAMSRTEQGAPKKHHKGSVGTKNHHPKTKQVRHGAVLQHQRTKHEFSTRIVGGSSASQSEYPFFVSWDGSCGASLIHEDIVLTAAHCNPIQSNSVRVSPYRLNSNTGGEETKRIVRRVPHPQYNDSTTAFDYMILKLDSAAQARPIAINRNNAQPEASEQLTVIGFGATSENGNQANILQEVLVPAVSHNVCNQQYNGEIQRDIMLCAGFTQGGRDSCQGDSGGPIFEFENGQPVQVGVVSFGEGCARPNKAGVYARVSGAKAWIDQQICALSANPPSSCGSSTTLPAPPAPGPSNPVPAPAPAPAPAPLPNVSSSPVSFPTPDSPPASPVSSPTFGSQGTNLSPDMNENTPSSPTGSGSEGGPVSFPSFGGSALNSPFGNNDNNQDWWGNSNNSNNWWGN